MIQNRAELDGTPARDVALACIESAIRAAHPRRVIRNALELDGGRLRVADVDYDLSAYERVLVLGGGNAAGHVSAALEAVLGERISGGAVVTDDPADTDVVEVLPGDHPVPSDRGVESTRRVLELAREADERTLVLAVITGGGSALLAAPADGIDLADLQSVTNALLASGADIHEMNAVRKHLSAIKGGNLARAAAPATVLGLVLSDVVGNDLDVIASGPTAPDNSTFADAIDVIDRYEIDVPAPVRERLSRGTGGELPETPRAGDAVFERVRNRVLADGLTALEAAGAAATDRGYSPLILSSRVRGEARESAKTHVAVAEECLASANPVDPPAVLLSGGETTVTVRGDGQGGPNEEFAMSSALELSDPRIVVASVDTDGIDGATDVAGAIVDLDTAADRRAAREALAANDVYPFLGERGALVRTGPTGTNVNDLRVLVVSPESAESRDSSAETVEPDDSG